MKIKKISIHSFRGIPKTLDVNFTDRKGNAISTLIFGDNGSGKSSIVDAIEFNLQAKIGRTEVLNNLLTPSPITWSSKIPIGSETKIQFEDDSINERSINVITQNGNYNFSMNNKKMCSDFSKVPIALRRNDIISFATTPIQSKQVLFFSFLYSPQKITVNDVINETIPLENDPLVMNLRRQLVDVKNKRRENVKALADLLSIDPLVIPYSVELKFNHFIKEFITNGVSTGKFKKVAKKADAEKLQITKQIKYFNNECKKISSQIKDALGSNKNISTERLDKNARFLEEASVFLSSSFKKISTVDYVDSIKVKLGKVTETSLEIDIILKNGRTVSPNRIFSEANLDLLVLLLYVSVIKVASNHGQSKLLIFDDTLQSVDSTIRLNFINYILLEFKDWQFIITAHDRLWINQLRLTLQRHGHPFKELEVYNWDFNNGPVVYEKNNFLYDNSLEVAIGTKDTIIIASQAGLTLEKICQILSQSLEITIKRKYEDKYTIGDLWPGLKKQFKNSDISPLLDKIDSLLMVRNLLGCHFNEWAISLSNHEILSFANDVYELYTKVFCRDCQNWIIKSIDYLAECPCHNIKISKTKK